jgi:hypothetical protein
MKKLVIASVIMLSGFSAQAQNTALLLNQYLSVKNALVSSDSKAAAQAGAALYQSLKSEGSFAQKNELLKATEQLNKAGGLEQQRAAFNDVSAPMWQLVRKSGKAEQAVYYQYCPMKKAYWLSQEKEIRNPYYGASMLHCGRVAETK